MFFCQLLLINLKQRSRANSSRLDKDIRLTRTYTSFLTHHAILLKTRFIGRTPQTRTERIYGTTNITGSSIKPAGHITNNVSQSLNVVVVRGVVARGLSSGQSSCGHRSNCRSQPHLCSGAGLAHYPDRKKRWG